MNLVAFHIWCFIHFAEAITCAIDSLLGGTSFITREAWLIIVIVMIFTDTAWVVLYYTYKKDWMITKGHFQRSYLVILTAVIAFHLLFAIVVFSLYTYNLGNEFVSNEIRFKEYLMMYPVSFLPITALWVVFIFFPPPPIPQITTTLSSSHLYRHHKT